MGKAFVCECGHTKTDHQSIKGVHKGHCDWFECECNLFIHESTEMRNRPTIQMDSMFEYQQRDKQDKKHVLKMNGLKFDGTPRSRKGGKS